MVGESDLDCARHDEDFWEPADRDDDDDQHPAMSGDDTERNGLHLFTRQRRLEPATETPGVIARSSNSGGSWNSPGGSDGGGEPPVAPRRPNRAAAPQGQERNVSYQPEERYWTDYLRIALPVVGLLLMLGLFWYWASNVIGDSGNTPKPTAAANVNVINADTPTPTITPEVQITFQPTATTAASGPATESNAAGASNSASGGNAGAANPTAATGSNSSGASGNSSGNSASSNSSNGASSNPSKFGNGDTVQTTSDGVNMRPDHSTAGDPVEQIPNGTELNVTGSGVKAEGYTWIPVTDPSTGNSGWVADEFVEAVNP